MKCIHCKTRDCNPMSRYSLCAECFGDPAVLASYCPVKPKQERYREPTEAELDAMIAEQMRNLPDWWPEEERRMAAGEPDE